MKHILSELKEALSYLEPYKEQPVIMPHGAYWILKKQIEEIKGLIFAFPSGNGPGMTLKQYAAITLKVPRSGDPELDAMILESRRADFAEKAMEGMVFQMFSETDERINRSTAKNFSEQVGFLADAMLAEWEKAKEEKKP
jgi:hypothetical protein